MRTQRLANLFLFVLGLASCARSSALPRAVPDARGMISRQTIERMNVNTAYEVLATRLNRQPSRPVRGSATSFERPQAPVVIIDGMWSDVATLHTLPASNVEEIRILNANEGTARYGTGATNGVIVISTRR
jgi:hypothetical protein